MTYTAWDGSGRPTVGTATGVNSNCVNQQITKTYDDASRTITTTRSGGTNCTSGISQTTYDSNGFVASTISGSSTTTNQVVTTDKICD